MNPDALLELARAQKDPEIRLLILERWAQAVNQAPPLPSPPSPPAPPSASPPVPPSASPPVPPSTGLPEAVRQALRSCRRCPLAGKVVVGEGPAPCRLALIGEAPGWTEEKTGRPFVGKAGRLLDRILAEIGIDRASVFISNACLCRPPDNRQPRADEIAACAGNLDLQLQFVRPRVVVTLGVVAARALGLDGAIGDIRGRLYRIGDHLVIPTVHPAAALRKPELEAPIREDLASAWRLVQAKETDLDPMPDERADGPFWREVLAAAYLADRMLHGWLHAARCLGAVMFPGFDGYHLDLPTDAPDEMIGWAHANVQAFRRLRRFRSPWLRTLEERPWKLRGLRLEEEEESVA